MKTKEEWHREWCASRYSSIADFVEAIQRDTHASATKAQMEKDGEASGHEYDFQFTLIPFPEDPKSNG